MNEMRVRSIHGNNEVQGVKP